MNGANRRSISIGGGRLKQHWETPLNEPRSARTAIMSKEFDVLVLQGFYYDFKPLNEPDANRDEFNQYADLFANLAQQNNMKVVFYGLWARDTRISPQADNFGPMNQTVYKAAAQRNNAAFAPNGMAYSALYGSYVNNLSESQIEDKLTYDSVHPSVQVAYMAANVVYSTIFGEQSPELSSFNPGNMSSDDAIRARDAAWNAVLDHSYNGNP